MKYYLKCTYDTQILQNNFNQKDWSGFYHEVYTNHRFEVSKKQMPYLDASFETDLEDPYFVVVIYGDGGTFGRTDGHIQYLPPMTYEQAEQVADLIRKNGRDDRTNLVEKLNEIIPLDKHFYPQWTGYFSSLEDVKILDSRGFCK